MGAESKGILKPSRFSAHVDEPAVHADEGDATPSATQTTHYKEFHSRVADVFANLGPGICGSGSTGGASDPTGSHQPPAEAVWMPANTTVTRRGARHDYSDDDDDEDEDGRIGRPKRNGNDDSSDDSRDDPSDEDDEEDRPTFDHTASNAEVSEVRRQRQKARWGEDLDCLESDEEGDDDQKKMAKLGRSVGRCSALNDEEEFDCYDTLAMTGMNRRQPMDRNGEGGIDVARIRRLVDGNDDEFEEVTPTPPLARRGSRKFSRQTSTNGGYWRGRARTHPTRTRTRTRTRTHPTRPPPDVSTRTHPESESERRRSIQSRGGVSGADLAGRTCPRIKGRRGSPGRRHPGASLGTIPCPRWSGPSLAGLAVAVGEGDAAEASPITSKTPTNTRATRSTNL